MFKVGGRGGRERGRWGKDYLMLEHLATLWDRR